MDWEDVRKEWEGGVSYGERTSTTYSKGTQMSYSHIGAVTYVQQTCKNLNTLVTVWEV